MKKTILLFAAVGAACLISFSAFTYSSGAPQGRNGSPLSQSVTCATGGCHVNGPAATSQTISISSDIPSTGFLENTLYNFTITLDDGGVSSSKVGFSASLEDPTGMVGIITPGSGTQKNGNFLTHTGGSSPKPNQSKDFNFVWNSGTAGPGTQVYVAANFSNANNSVGGDVIITESLALTKASGLSLNENIKEKFEMSPNPAKEYVNISELNPSVSTIEIYSLDGKLQKSYDREFKKASMEWHLDLSDLRAGSYLLLPRGSTSIQARKLEILK